MVKRGRAILEKTSNYSQFDPTSQIDETRTYNGVDMGDNRERIKILKDKGELNKASWLNMRTLNYWNLQERKLWKRAFSIPKANEETLVIPDKNMGLGDYYFLIATLEETTSKYKLITKERDLTLNEIIKRRNLENIQIVENTNLEKEIMRYSRVIPISQLHSELTKTRKENHEIENIIINKEPRKILCQAYSGNNNKEGNYIGYKWIESMLSSKDQLRVYIMQTSFNKNNSREIMKIKYQYKDRLKIIDPANIFAQPNNVFHYVNVCDLTIGVSCTLTCMSASIGKPTMVILPSSGGNGKWMQANTRKLEQLFPNLKKLYIGENYEAKIKEFLG